MTSEFIFHAFTTYVDGAEGEAGGQEGPLAAAGELRRAAEEVCRRREQD